MQPGAAEEVPIKTLLITVFESIAEVFLLCIAGYTLAYTGVTDKATQRKLNVINVSLFTPALLFSKVAFSLTPSKLKEMWIIPLGFVVITGVSAVVAWIMSKMFKLKKSQTAFAICAAMFQNSNSLPIALVQSLVADVPGLKWGNHDSKDQMLGRALTYMVLYSTLGMVLRWSYGVKLLANADDEDEVHQPAVSPSGEVLPEYTPVMSPEPLRDDPFGSLEGAATSLEERAATNRAIANRSMDIHAASAIIERGRQQRSSQDEFRPSSLPLGMRSPFGSSPSRGSPLPRRRPSSVSRSSSTRRPAPSRTDSGRDFWNLPEQPRRQTLVDLAEDSSESEAEDADEWGTHEDCGHGDDELPLLRRRTPPPMSTVRRLLQRTKLASLHTWNKVYEFMTVPTWAALISIIIALIPPLQAQVAGVRPFVAAVKSAGQCSIPLTLVVLGAFFYKPAPPSIALPADQADIDHTIKGYFERKIRSLKGNGNSKEDKAYEGENRAVFVAVVSRMIVVPVLFLPLIALLAKEDYFLAAEDPVFILCAVLLVSSPPALTLAQLTQAASGDAFERLISKTISWSYAVLTPPLTLVYVVIGLVFAHL